MSSHPTWFVGNRDPAITDVIRNLDGTPVNLTGAAVRFKAREVGTNALLVDQPVSNAPGADGVVRYDWSAADIAANGALADPRYLLVWWQVTRSGNVQDVNEAIIEVRAHAPQPRAYVELEDAKESAELKGTSFADRDLQEALESASRGLDYSLGRRFYSDADALGERLYTAVLQSSIDIDDLLELTSLKTDDDGDGVYESTWVAGTDFVLEPANAEFDGRPWNRIRILTASGTNRWPRYPNAIKVTGRFGWTDPPPEIRQATRIIARRLLERARGAPFGVVALGPDSTGVRAVSIANDPELNFLLAGFRRRSRPLVA